MKQCKCGCGQLVKSRGDYRWGHHPRAQTTGDIRLCACGCGAPVRITRHSRYYAVNYLQGHNQKAVHRGTPPYVPTPEEIPSGLCECGCGKSTDPVDRTNRSLRWFKGHPRPFIPGHHACRPVRRPCLCSVIDELPAEKVGYLAGILDGEGTISMRNARSVRISIANTDETLMAWLSILGGHVSALKPFPNRRQVYRWSIGHREDCVRFLQIVLPHLCIKRASAEEALRNLATLPHRRHLIPA